ncbi:MAG: tryptophan--tRNA ligase [Bdellovibrionota bacterium]|nr:tryptophan--tRNA ligase [Bdellovibrionota bacterium]
MSKARVMSGMRTTERIHLGNYFGALKNWVRLQDETDYECFFGAMDWHALTDAFGRANEINEVAREVIADWIAYGINPEKSVIFIQSQVPQHLEINMILSNITPFGWLDRVTTWKDAKEELQAKDAHNLGRFGYPVLQTADILAYQGTHVPVGRDQVPHLELSREIVRRFNRIYKANLPEMEALLTESPVLPGLDGRKMSKSYGNHIPLTESAKKVKKLCNKMLTDPKRETREDPGEPEDCQAVYKFHKLVSSAEDLSWVEEGCRTAGIGCGDCKARLAENLNKIMEEPREIKKELLNNPKNLDDIIQDGCARARKEANETLRMMRDAMGFKSFDYPGGRS